MPHPHIRVSGDPRERGRRYGEAARERVQLSLAGYERAFAVHAGWSWAQARAAAERHVPAILMHAPAAMTEMEGIASGAGVEAEDILALNARTEVVAAAWAREARAARATDGCSALAVLPERSTTGHTLLAQNWDWMLHVVDTVVVLEVGAEDGSGYVTAVEAGLLAKSGLNAAGLGLATNFLLSPGDDGRAGVPYHVTLRAILDAASADEAVDMLRAMPRCSSANYLLADAGGRAVDVEVLPGDALHVIEPVDGFLAHTNHFCAAEATAFEAGGALMPSSPLRLERLEALLGASGQRIGPADIRTALSDHVNFPAAVCCHPDPDLAESDRDITAVSIVMDLDSRRVELADGNPCSTPYRELDYASFLGSQVASAS